MMNNIYIVELTYNGDLVSYKPMPEFTMAFETEYNLKRYGHVRWQVEDEFTSIAGKHLFNLDANIPRDEMLMKLIGEIKTDIHRKKINQYIDKL